MHDCDIMRVIFSQAVEQSSIAVALGLCIHFLLVCHVPLRFYLELVVPLLHLPLHKWLHVQVGLLVGRHRTSLFTRLRLGTAFLSFLLFLQAFLRCDAIYPCQVRIGVLEAATFKVAVHLRPKALLSRNFFDRRSDFVKV